MTSPRVLLGVIAAAHGIKGEAKVKTFTSSPENLSLYGPLLTEDGRSLVVAHLRAGHGDEAVVRFKGFDDRNAVESLKGQRLYVPRAMLPEPEQGEFYQTDLIGLRVEAKDGTTLGKVAGVHNFGAGDVIEIECVSGETIFIPFTDAVVPIVDIKGGRIVADPPRSVDDEQ